jgi:hypothetical protein
MNASRCEQLRQNKNDRMLTESAKSRNAGGSIAFGTEPSVEERDDWSSSREDDILVGSFNETTK